MAAEDPGIGRGGRLALDTRLTALRRGAVAPESVWVLTDEGDVLRVDPDEERVARTIRLGVNPPQLLHAIATGEGAV